MTSRQLASSSAAYELKQLGENIVIARKRRKLTQKHLANAAGVTPETIRSLERGNAGISLGTLAMVLLALGQKGCLEKILTPPTDAIGIVIGINDLPKRIRIKKAKNIKKQANLDSYAQIGDYVGF
jgi:transcriptional regulator with XRE-family HTH domain